MATKKAKPGLLLDDNKITEMAILFDYDVDTLKAIKDKQQEQLKKKEEEKVAQKIKIEPEEI